MNNEFAKILAEILALGMLAWGIFELYLLKKGYGARYWYEIPSKMYKKISAKDEKYMLLLRAAIKIGLGGATFLALILND